MSRSQGEGEGGRGGEGERERGRAGEGRVPFAAKKPGFRLVMPLKLASCWPAISE